MVIGDIIIFYLIYILVSHRVIGCMSIKYLNYTWIYITIIYKLCTYLHIYKYTNTVIIILHSKLLFLGGSFLFAFS